uniref:Conserved plasma membrane protein n=1 Tax=Panagrellus redivivus TaxID=6233 RepID=A0A7E4ZWB6_PANRE
MLLSADLDAVTLVERSFPTDSDLEESNSDSIDDKDPAESTRIFHPQHIRHYITFALCALLIGFVVTFICCCLCVFCCFSRISWSRFRSPSWYNGTCEPKVTYTSGSSRFNTLSTRTTGQSKHESCCLSPCNDGSTSNDSSFNNNHDVESQSLSPKSS